MQKEFLKSLYNSTNLEKIKISNRGQINYSYGDHMT